jgi:hypothetical protein
LVACGKALFRLGIRCRFGEDFLSVSKIRAQIKLLPNLCQNRASPIQSNCPKSMQCQNQYNAKMNGMHVKAALSLPTYGI